MIEMEQWHMAVSDGALGGSWNVHEVASSRLVYCISLQEAALRFSMSINP